MLRRIFQATTKSQNLIFSRQIRYRVRSDTRQDPGISRRQSEFPSDFKDNDPDDIEAMEADLMNVHEVHKDYEREKKKHREVLPNFIVKQKYFKEKQTNFLTWAEKEQIKLLHEKDKDFWTFEKLSDSFPADPETIAKIAKNRWLPRTEKRVLKHDQSVRENWKLFQEGKLKVDPLLAHHLKNFNRGHENLITQPKVHVKIKNEIPKPQNDEFSSIITTCKKYKNKANEEENRNEILRLSSTVLQLPPSDPEDPEEQNTIVLEGKSFVGGRKMSLSQLKEKLPHLAEESSNSFEKRNENSIGKFPNFANIEKYKKDDSEKSMTVQKPSEIALRSLQIREHIKIPKKLWKRDQIYKVEDCFYDSDGEFLYRVPGLKN